MASWQQWLLMAVESNNAAEDAQSAKHWRSSVSRYYYSAYQAVSAVLIYRGPTPPPEEEAWGHASTPDMIVEHFAPYIRSKDVRQRYANQLRELYSWRIKADYRGKANLQDATDKVRMFASRLMQLAETILPEV